MSGDSNRMAAFGRGLLPVALLLGCATAASAADTVRLVYETRADSNPPGELKLDSFNSLNSFYEATVDSGRSLNIGIASTYRVAAFDIYDQRPYLLLQKRDDTNDPGEVLLASFDSLDAMYSADGSLSGSFVNLNVPTSYQIAGFDIYDDKPYLLLETRADSGGPGELLLQTFDSLDAFRTGGPAISTFVNLDVPASHRAVGFDIHDEKPYLLLETRADTNSSVELLLSSFDSLTSFRLGETASTDSIGINVPASYLVAGFDITGDEEAGEPEPSSAVPEPATWLSMILGFAAIGIALRRRTGARNLQRLRA